MNTVQSKWGTGVNAEAIEAWDGPLFERFVPTATSSSGGLGKHGDEGCGSTRRRREGVRWTSAAGSATPRSSSPSSLGPDGSVLGVDAAPRFIEAAREEAAQGGRRERCTLRWRTSRESRSGSV